VLFFWNDAPLPVARSLADPASMVSKLPESAHDAIGLSVSPPAHTAVQTRSNNEADRRAAEGRRIEEAARAQIAAENQQRTELERQRKETERASGKDYHVPLDRFSYIPMDGGDASIKIHDNDVTSFDVWVNGSYRREVLKEKGMTHSGTDETLIHRSGRSSLYYVWQISGKLDHCLLRVREN
jgi:hypothetical protein